MSELVEYKGPAQQFNPDYGYDYVPVFQDGFRQARENLLRTLNTQYDGSFEITTMGPPVNLGGSRLQPIEYRFQCLNPYYSSGITKGERRTVLTYDGVLIECDLKALKPTPIIEAERDFVLELSLHRATPLPFDEANEIIKAFRLHGSKRSPKLDEIRQLDQAGFEMYSLRFYRPVMKFGFGEPDPLFRLLKGRTHFGEDLPHILPEAKILQVIQRISKALKDQSFSGKRIF